MPFPNGLRLPACAVVCAIVFCVILPRQLLANSLVPVNREDVIELLHGRVDFENLTASPMPGTRYQSRIPFHGLVAATRFVGQISILRTGDFRPYGENAGAPATDLKETARGSRYSHLHALAIEGDDPNQSLTSSAFVPNKPRSSDEVGFGVVVLKFSNRQFSFGFDLLQISNDANLPPLVFMRLYGQDGEELFEPVLLTEFGRYTWMTKDMARTVKGIEFINPGPVGFSVDEIVFEVPLQLGSCLRC